MLASFVHSRYYENDTEIIKFVKISQSYSQIHSVAQFNLAHPTDMCVIAG